MGIIVAIEGADGVGKNTTSSRLRDTLCAAGRTASVIGFPRYGETVAGVTIGRYMAGDIGVAVTPYAAATLYGLDRFEWRASILEAVEGSDVLIFDRYVASNMAYQAARVDESEARTLMDWILALETGQFALPVPTLSIYLDTPWELAKAMILQKAERSYTPKTYDEYEADVALQQRVRANYEAIVAADLLGPWRIVRASESGAMRSPDDIVAEIVGHISLK
ncbi:dTMP kinase [Sphingomonas sp.]|jgi:dTMP kinase|uniref:dTMP kinase n=1 Tax=Sphingomonas sp. TaxID=28214 RepID=UPI002EDAB027